MAAEIVTQGGPVEYNGHLTKDSTAIALIAYLQRVGTDLFKTEEPVAPGTPGSPEAPAAATPEATAGIAAGDEQSGAQ